MSAVDPVSRGSTLLTFKLGERVSATVWQAEDTRNGRKVAVKVLSRQLPKDPARREALVRDVRLGAAMYHASLVNILEVAPAGDALLLVMEWIEGQPISARARAGALNRAEFFRVAYQIVDALRLLHAKNLVHGNVAGDSILILPSGQAKLCGLNLTNLMQRQGPSAFQQKGGDAKAVAYMAPEQVSNQPVTVQTDIFSLGLVLYEAATGKLAYQGANAAEIARKVVEEQPPSPKSINPNIDNAVLSVMGKCLFKDPFRRHKDAKTMSEEIARADPDAVKFADGIAKAGAAPAAQKAAGAETRSAILFLADVANYALEQSDDPSAAVKAAARMQQVLGEAVYLFDGEVLDPFGPRLIASLPSVEQAIEAGRKGEFDFSPEQQGESQIPVRLLLHAGEVEVRDGKAGGVGVEKGLEVLQTLPPMKLHITEDFLKKGRGNVRVRDVGAKAGVKLYNIIVPEPEPEPEPEEVKEEPVEVAEAEEAAAAAAVAAATAKKKRKTLIVAAAVAAVVVVVGAGAAMLLMSRPKSRAAAAARTSRAGAGEMPPASAATPRKILLQPFTVEGADPALPARAESVRLASIEVLRAYPELQIAESGAQDVTSFTATVRTGTAGPEIVTGSNAVPMLDAASGVQSVIQLVSAQLHLPPRATASAEAFNAFAEAVAARAANDPAKTEASLREAIKADSNFFAAQMLAMRFFAMQGKDADALTAARAVLSGDPANVEAARIVARASLSSGDLAGMFGSYAVILKKDPNDLEALNTLGRYACAANDAEKFNAVLRRLASVPLTAAIQEPDMLMAAGKIDSAVQSYYTVEEKVQNNPALALKIGRFAVLRHSMPIAEIELKKLQESDPNYGLHILKAYIAAQSGAKAEAANELKAALSASKPGDDYWTSVAEVAVINGDTPGVIDALKRAAARKEPTGSYVLASPLFQFLGNDPEFQKVREDIAAQQNEIRTALASIQL